MAAVKQELCLVFVGNTHTGKSAALSFLADKLHGSSVDKLQQLVIRKLETEAAGLPWSQRRQVTPHISHTITYKSSVHDMTCPCVLQRKQMLPRSRPIAARASLKVMLTGSG